MRSRYPGRASHTQAHNHIAYEQLLQNLPEPVCILNEEGLLVFANHSYLQRTGYDAQPVIGRPFVDFVTAEDHTMLKLALGRADERPSAVATHIRIRSNNGCLIAFPCEIQKSGQHYFIKAAATRSQEEETLAIQFDRKLKEQQRQLRDILERIGEGFIAVDESSRITYWNRQAEKILGRKREDMLAQEIWTCYPEAAQTAFFSYYNKALKEQKPQQYEAYDPDEQKWLQVSLYPSPSGMTGFIRDVTEEKALHEQLDLQKKEQQQRITSAVIQAQEKERAHVGQELHDNVNQVLTTVKLYTELCLSRPDNLEELLKKSVSLLQHSITEIRTLSWKLSAPTLGKIRMKDSVQELAHAVSETGKIEIDLDYQCIRDQQVSDELHLAVYRILQEQLTNILKHATATLVELTVECADKELIVKIRDNGKGFDAAAKRAGIGISNMISRAESLGGRLSVNSAPGLGCVLIAQFPFE